MARHIQTFIIDSFTTQAFKGNPAGVCLLRETLSPDLMLSIAKELGFSETAFVLGDVKTGNYKIRYFSPKMEIPLCGHATLAASKVLFHQDSKLSQIHFNTLAHLELKVARSEEGIQMEFPVYETNPAVISVEALDALGIKEVENIAFNKEIDSYIIELADADALRNLHPDFAQLVKVEPNISGISVTARSKESPYDFESRYFWPWKGTNEDPVTGGAHTYLAKYWASRLNKTKMKAFQCSERSGILDVELINEGKMTITGHAQIVFTGQLILN